ncbi:hypothetical protein [Corynebacterium bovis]
MAKSNTVATSAERFSPEWYTRSRLGDQFELVLRIKDRIADGASAPVIDDFDAVKAVVKDRLSGAQWEAAKKTAAVIHQEWTADQTLSQVKQAQAQWLEKLQAAADGARSGDDAAGSGGLAGLVGMFAGGADAGQDSARQILDADRLRRTALLVAAGPQAVPDEAWAAVREFAGEGA